MLIIFLTTKLIEPKGFLAHVLLSEGGYPLWGSNCTSHRYVGIRIGHENLSRLIIHVMAVLGRGGGAPCGLLACSLDLNQVRCEE